MTPIRSVGVLGAGSFGTSLAALLADKGIAVTLWSHGEDSARAIQEEHENKVYLPGIKLPESLQATTDLASVVAGKDLVLSVPPSHVVREVWGRAARHLAAETIVVSASKGIEVESGLVMSQVLEQVLPVANRARLAFLSGPSFAREVAQKMPTAVAIASAHDAIARTVQEALATPYFRAYTNDDVMGVEIGGALKNVVAIACGVSDGLGLGFNTRAAIITRGLAEITRLGIKLGAKPLTFAGLAGMGDLVLTCTGDLSRNRTVGMRLGKGEKLGEILASMRMVAEGVRTTRSAYELAIKLYIDMPLTTQIHAMLYKGQPPRGALASLMGRDLKPELAGIAS